MEREAAAVCREWSELLVAADRSEEAASIASRRAGLARATRAKPWRLKLLILDRAASRTPGRCKSQSPLLA